MYSLREVLDLNRALGALLSSTGDKAVESLVKFQSEYRGLLKGSKKMAQELAEFVAADLVGKAEQSQERAISYHREESSLAFLSSIADSFLARWTALSCSSCSSFSPLLFLTCSESTDGKDGQFLLFSPPPSTLDLTALGAEAATLMGGKGGGKGCYQGKATRVDRRAEALSALEAKLKK